MRPLFLASLLCLALSACGEDAPKPARRIDAPQEALSRVGDVTIRANVIATEGLGEAMAKQYGIARDPDTVLLLVSVRRGPEGRDTALPATIDAEVADLRGQRRRVSMREIRSGEYVDYVGTVEIARPDTLSFELRIVREDGASSDMRFSRDFAR